MRKIWARLLGYKIWQSNNKFLHDARIGKFSSENANVDLCTHRCDKQDFWENKEKNCTQCVLSHEQGLNLEDWYMGDISTLNSQTNPIPHQIGTQIIKYFQSQLHSKVPQHHFIIFPLKLQEPPQIFISCLRVSGKAIWREA